MGLNEEPFDKVNAYLREAIEEQSVESDYVQVVMDVVESTRDETLNK